VSEHTIEELRARIKPEGPWFDVPAGVRESECRTCTAGIYWIRTAAGRPMPIDCYVQGGSAPTPTENGKGVAHFATCPTADQHRRPR
jgi:hypothetical protein